LTGPEAESFAGLFVARYPASGSGQERYRDIDAFADAVVPALERLAEAWTRKAANEQRPATAYRPTLMLTTDQLDGDSVHYDITEVAAKSRRGAQEGEKLNLRPGCVAFQADGRVLAASGDGLFFFVDDRPFPVALPKDSSSYAEQVRQARFVVNLGELGFAIVSPKRVLMLRSGKWSLLAAPARAEGEVGEIQASLAMRGGLAVVTAETDESEGGPEVWRTSDGVAWGAPIAIPMNGGDVHVASEGPYGTLFVGSKQGKRARAAFLGLDGPAISYTGGVGQAPPLLAATCSNDRTAWAASNASVLRFDRSSAEVEPTEHGETPVHMALDLVGIPWLVTERSVLRREALSTASKWRLVHRRDALAPPFVAMGFTPDGARVMDSTGGGVRIVPGDVARWRGDTALVPKG
jgi:hypothetical protein